MLAAAGTAGYLYVDVSRRLDGSLSGEHRRPTLRVFARSPERRAGRANAPLLTALAVDARAKQRHVPLADVPPYLVQAVLAIEDRRFYDHPGVDVIRATGALVTNLRGGRPYLEGGSTITQQLVKNLVLTPDKTLRRKLQEQFMAILVERRLTKDRILELYLNEVYLGQRGSFAIHGVAEASRLFFCKDLASLTLAEAATIAGLIQAPSLYSPFRSPERARARRGVVLNAMVDAGYLTRDAATRAGRESAVVVAGALDAEAPYFVDFVTQHLDDQLTSADAAGESVDVYTTVDLELQRLAEQSVREGLDAVDTRLADAKRTGRVQAGLVAVDPRTGDIVAMVGGRSYGESQYNRAVSARRQPGSVFKPFVYLAAFERGLEETRKDLSPATVVWDEPATFEFGGKTYAPSNYASEYDGRISLRRALARSRNVATVKVAEWAGYDRVADLWRRTGAQSAPQPYPSIALGAFEATPLEIASAYSAFATGGVVRPLRAVLRVEQKGRAAEPDRGSPHRVASPATTYLVTDMLRSVMDEGTGAGARAEGFLLDAAGKSGTTNDLRDAWFVGFTPELLTVVWVGFDDNRPLGLSGTQAALPIWTRFMRQALKGHANTAFVVPDGVTFAEIDPETGDLASPACPRVAREVFLTGTEPAEPCRRHRARDWYNLSLLRKREGLRDR